MGRLLLALIIGTAALRIAFGATLGLGVDESYMVASGRALSFGYFDHPPAAWWLSWGAAHLFGSEIGILRRRLLNVREQTPLKTEDQNDGTVFPLCSPVPPVVKSLWLSH